jgi:CBS domain-containing protein
MRRNVATVGVEASVVEASKIMMERGLAFLIATEKAKPVGIVTESDLVFKVMAKEREPSKVKVSEVMSAPLVYVGPDATVQEAVEAMVKHKVRRLPVVRENTIYGVFTARDLVRHFNEYMDKVLRDVFGAASLFPLGGAEVR